ncbi:formate dehydrogenase cytochrome b556 subunit, partial [Paraburkholderia hospita]
MKHHRHENPDLIVRYTPNERTNHWITAITFVLLALSGLALFHPSMFWLSALFGGGQWTRILHPFIG